MKIKNLILISIFLVIAILFVPNTVNADNATDENGINWTYDLQNGEAINVKPTDKTTLPQEVTIPKTLNGYNVTSIGYQAFYFIENIKSVTIPDTVTLIGEQAFYICKDLESITIPNSVTIIGDYAFQNCFNLKEVTIPNSVTTIGRSVFSNCSSLTSVIIPNSVNSIGQNLFYGCSELTSVTLSNSLTIIPQSTFSSCTKLTSVTLPESITTIEPRAFMSCQALTSIKLPLSLTSIDSEAFIFCNSLVVTISDLSQLKFEDALDGKVLKMNYNGSEIEILKYNDEYFYFRSEKDALTSEYHWIKDGKEFSFEVKDGKDGATPIIQINEKTGELEVSYDDGKNWTSLGKVVGKDGSNGENGKDGVTPKLQINSKGELEVSYDEGKTWTSLGKVVGEDGKDGQDGKDGKDGAAGKDGTNGADGKNGKDGKDATSTTTNGKNGEDGKDGITPKLRINDKTGELEASYDEGKTWSSLGTVVGKDGTDGKTEVIQNEADIKYGIVEYIICALAVLGNIGWIVALKRRK